MSYQVKNLDSCTKKISFELENVDLDSKVQEGLKKKAKEVTIKGFRKGKAPLQVVEKIYKAQIKVDALEKFVSEVLSETFQKENIVPVGRPGLESFPQEGEDKKMSFDVIVETYPEFELDQKKLDNIQVTEENYVVTDEEYEAEILRLREEKAQIVEVKDAEATIQEKDFVSIECSGKFEDGTVPEIFKNTQESFFEMQEGRVVPELYTALLGMKAGEEKDVAIEYPENYPEKSLNGKKVTLHAKILELKRKELPEFNDEFAKSHKADSLEDLTTQIRTRLLNNKKREARKKIEEDVLKELIEAHPFKVPAAFIESEKEQLRKSLAKFYQMMGQQSQHSNEEMEKGLKEQAEFRLKSGILLDKLAKTLELEVSDADIEAHYAREAEEKQIEVDELKKLYNEQDASRRQLQQYLLEQKVFAHVAYKK